MPPNLLEIIVALAMLCVATGCPRSPGPIGSGSPGSAGSPASEPDGARVEPPAAPGEPGSEAAETMFLAVEERLGRIPWRLRLELAAEGL